MKKIGILSDTHGHWDDRYATYFAQVDEIWHAGDIGNFELADRLGRIARLRAVHGNIDGGTVRRIFPRIQRFPCEEADVMITHIGGHPGRYEPDIRAMFERNPPNIFVCGHSHILNIAPVPAYGLLHINPGAAGLSGWQQKRTLVRLQISGRAVSNVEVIELG